MDALSMFPTPSVARRGSIQLITGPMFSGKTTELLHRLRRLGYAKRRVMLVRYCRDNRYSAESVATHDRFTDCGNDCTTFSVSKLSELPEGVTADFDVVGIDEGQFFTDLLEFADRTANAGRLVIISALDGDFLRQPFGSMCDLVPRSESLMKLTAICQAPGCGRAASYSTRISAETSVEVIGGADKYIPTCRFCYNRQASLTAAARARQQEAQVYSPPAVSSKAESSAVELDPASSSSSSPAPKERRSSTHPSPVSVMSGPEDSFNESDPKHSDEAGRLELVIGPMFSGKTTKMLHCIRRHGFANKRVLLVKYCKDQRYSVGSVATHDNVTGPAGCHTLSVASLSQVGDEYKNYDVIGVDEGQFYPDLAEFADRVASEGKVVIVAALDGDFLRNPFGDICRLIPRAEVVTKITAVCMMCGCNASFSRRISAEQDVEVIGGADKYLPTCRECYHSASTTTLTTPTAESRTKASISSPNRAFEAEEKVVENDVRQILFSESP